MAFRVKKKPSDVRDKKRVYGTSVKTPKSVEHLNKIVLAQLVKESHLKKLGFNPENQKISDLLDLLCKKYDKSPNELSLSYRDYLGYVLELVPDWGKLSFFAFDKEISSKNNVVVSVKDTSADVFSDMYKKYIEKNHKLRATIDNRFKKPPSPYLSISEYIKSWIFMFAIYHLSLPSSEYQKFINTEKSSIKDFDKLFNF